jgi:hypothetical protein
MLRPAEPWFIILAGFGAIMLGPFIFADVLATVRAFAVLAIVNVVIGPTDLASASRIAAKVSVRRV